MFTLSSLTNFAGIVSVRMCNILFDHPPETLCSVPLLELSRKKCFSSDLTQFYSVSYGIFTLSHMESGGVIPSFNDFSVATVSVQMH